MRLRPPAPAAAAPGSASAFVVWSLLLSVGIVLADSSVVTLALPDIVGEFDVPVGEVTWVLIAYNLVLALGALPAAWWCTRAAGAGRSGVIGLVVFAAASAVCALAGSLDVLIGARIVQGIGGALVVAASLDLLVTATGSRHRGAALWAAAGVAGTAIGPVAGGVLTEAIAWPAIFAVQVPLVLLAVPAAWGLREAGARPAGAESGAAATPDGPGPLGATEVATSRRDRALVHIALAFLSAALTAALFLLVLLLIEGFRRSPITAAFAVTVMPVAAILTRAAIAGRAAEATLADRRSQAVAGAILIAGGLVALGVLPGSGLGWTVVPQVLIGAGLALTIEPLTSLAIDARSSLVLQGGWNIAARHVGIVLGLAILTPVFVDGLEKAEPPAKRAVTALVLDSQLPVTAKLGVAANLVGALDAAENRIPDLGPAFDAAPIQAADRPAAGELQAALEEQLDRAASRAFQASFLIAGGLGLLAVLPMLLLGRGASRQPTMEPGS